MDQKILKENREKLEKSKKVSDGEGILGFVCHNEKFGDLYVYFVSSNEVAPNLFVVEGERVASVSETEEEDCPYQALMTLDGRILVDFDEMDLVDFFSTKDHSQYCFTFENTNTHEKQSYLIHNLGDDYCSVVPSEDSFKANYWFDDIELDYGEFWMCTRVNQFGLEEFQVYSPADLSFVSNIYNSIDFDGAEETPFLAYFEKMLYDIDPDNPESYVIYTSLIGYLNENFMPGAEIYDMTSGEYIPTFSWHDLSRFDLLEERLKDKYHIKYLEKMAKGTNALAYMINHPNPKSEGPKGKEKAKLYAFPNITKESE